MSGRDRVRALTLKRKLLRLLARALEESTAKRSGRKARNEDPVDEFLMKEARLFKEISNSQKVIDDTK